MKNALNQSEAAAILGYVTETASCINGPLDLLGNPTRFAAEVDLICNDAYNQEALLCGKTLKEIFVANRADTSLCRLVSHATTSLSRNSLDLSRKATTSGTRNWKPFQLRGTLSLENVAFRNRARARKRTK